MYRFQTSYLSKRREQTNLEAELLKTPGLRGFKVHGKFHQPLKNTRNLAQRIKLPMIALFFLMRMGLGEVLVIISFGLQGSSLGAAC